MINQPVTIYYAKKDEMIPFMAAQEMYRYLKNFTFNEMTITGNHAHIEICSNAFLKVLQQYK